MQKTKNKTDILYITEIHVTCITFTEVPKQKVFLMCHDSIYNYNDFENKLLEFVDITCIKKFFRLKDHEY